MVANSIPAFDLRNFCQITRLASPYSWWMNAIWWFIKKKKLFNMKTLLIQTHGQVFKLLFTISGTFLLWHIICYLHVWRKSTFAESSRCCLTSTFAVGYWFVQSLKIIELMTIVFFNKLIDLGCFFFCAELSLFFF